MKNSIDSSKYYYLTSGNWATVVNASDRSSALKEAFERILENTAKYQLGPVIICLNVEDAVKELSLEDALKFIPTADAADEMGNPKLAIAIKTLFGYE